MGLAETAQLTAQLNLKGDFNRNIGKAQRNLKGFSGQLNKLGGQAKQSILTGVGLGGGVAAFGLFSTAVSGAIGLMGDSVRMAAEEEAAINQLSRAIKENDEAWDGNMRAVEDRITALQELAYSDAEQRESLQLLIGQTGDVEEAFRLLGTSMDFARYRGIDLKTSADLLGRAYAGNFQTLSRYGVVLDKGATATEALAQIQKMAAGQAREYADSAIGQFERAQIAWGDAQEDLGRVLLPVMTDLATFAADTLPEVVKGAQEAAAALQPVADVLGSIGDAYDDISGVVPQEVKDIFGSPLGPVAGSLGFLGSQAEGLIGEGTMIGDIWNAGAEAVEDFGLTSRRAATAAEMLAGRQAQLNAEYGNTAPAASGAAAGIREITEAADWATARIAGLGSALEHVAGTSFSSVQSAAKSTQAAIREAAKSNTWAALAKERDRLQRQQGAARFQQGDVQAVIAQRLAVIETQIAQRRQVSRAFRGEGNVGAATGGGAQALNAIAQGNDKVAQNLSLGLTQLAADNQAALASLGETQGTSLGSMTTSLTNGLATVSGSIAALPPPPAPIVDVDVFNNVSATTVESNITKVVNTNRARPDVEGTP